MAYTLPQFNLLCNLWTCDGNIKPSAGDPDFTDVPVQKYVASRASWPTTPPWSAGFYLAYHPPVQLRFQRTGPFAGTWRAWKVTCVEVPAGSGQYYRTFWGDVQHEGFNNEYVLLVGVQCTEDLLAFPPPGAAEETGVGADACGIVPPAAPPNETLPPGPWPPAVPTPTVGLIDTFVDAGGTPIASHVADTGQTWSLGSGDLEIEGTGIGLVAIDTTPGPHWAVVNYTGDNTVSVNLEVTTTNLTQPDYFGVIYRATDANNWWMALVEYDPGPPDWKISFYKCVAGVTTSMQTGTTGVALSPNTSYDLTLEFAGALTNAQLVLFGSVVVNEMYTDTTDMSQTGVGLFLYCDATHPSPLVSRIDR